MLLLILVCLTGIAESQQLDVEVRLKNNYSRRDRGTVEMRYNASQPWGTICDDSWDLNDARVVCKMLGFLDACEAHSNAYYGQGTGPIFLDDVRCAGSESSLLQCGNNGWGINNCAHGEDAGVTCFSDVPLSSDPLNLVTTSVGSSSFAINWEGECSAQYQVYLNDTLITTTSTKAHTFAQVLPGCRYSAAVCKTSRTPCRSITVSTGLESVRNFTARAAHQYVTLNWQLTSGCTESYRLSCRPSCDPIPTINGAVSGAVIGPLQQGQAYTITVQAISGSSFGPASSAVTFIEAQSLNLQVRLKNNYARTDRGTVEIRYNSSEPWGTICSSSWDLNDARVICRMLGFQDACGAHLNAFYGQGTGQVLLNSVACEGSETNILHCGNDGWGSTHCGHSSDAGVTCRSNVPLSSDPLNLVATSVGSSSFAVQWDGGCSAQYQVSLNNTLKTTTSTKAYTFADISPGCRYKATVCNVNKLPCSSITVLAVPGSVKYFTADVAQQSVTLKWQLATGCAPESYRLSCQPSCDPVAPISGSATTALIGPLRQGQAYTITIQAVSGGLHSAPSSAVAFIESRQLDVKVRLKNNNTWSDRGTVEIRYNASQPWGTICDDGWDLQNARVICKMLGFLDACKAHSNAYYGQGTGSILLDDVRCTGAEPSVVQCGNNGWGLNNCNHGEDAGVTCLANVPGSVRNFTANIDQQSVILNWELTTGCAPESYRLSCQPSCDPVPSISGTDTTAVIGPLKQGQSYTITIQGISGTSYGPISNAVAFIESRQLNVEVRLKNNYTRSDRGTVEIRYNASQPWGTICDDGWRLDDARVICKMLGFMDACEAHSDAYYGQGTGPIVLDDIQCIGSESSVVHCGNTGWGINNCHHGEDAGVTCLSNVPLSSDPLNLVTTSVRSSSFAVKWDGACSAKYQVSLNNTLKTTTSTKAYTFANVPPGCRYNATVCNVNKMSCSSITVSTVPESVGNFTVTAVQQFVILNWRRTSSCGPESYLLSCQPSCDPVPFIGGTVTTAVIGPLKQGQAYTITIQGVSGSSYGPSSSALTFIESQNLNVEVRLTNNYTRRDRGTVQIRYNASQPWGTICDDGWDLNDARVICKMLGFLDACEAHTNGYHGKGSEPIFLDNVRCAGSESSVIQCGNDGWGINNCHRDQIAGVTCLSNDTVSSDPWNLVTTSVDSLSFTVKWDGECYSQYQVYLNDTLITTTSTKTYTFAQVLPGCRYTVAVCKASRTPCSSITIFTVPAAVSNFTARAAHESVILNWKHTTGCPPDSYGLSCQPSCGPIPFISGTVTTAVIRPQHQGQVYTLTIEGIRGSSYGPSSSTIAFIDSHNLNLEVRLKNNYTWSDRGTVEIRYNTSEPWGTICDDNWDLNDARVICKMLGFQDACQARTNAYYGQGTGPILLDDLHCTGIEPNVLQCANRGWGINDCHHHEDAGVTCLSYVPGSVRNFTARATQHFVILNWELTTGCAPESYRLSCQPSCDLVPFISGTVTTSVIGPLKQGQAYTISIQGVRGTSYGPLSSALVFIDSQNQNVEVRLRNNYTWSDRGTVEIRYNTSQPWGTICDDGWDLNDARVICKMLGFKGACQARMNAHYGLGSGPILLDNVQCTGSESSIVQCGNRGWGIHNCGHHKDAGVACLSNVPGSVGNFTARTAQQSVILNWELTTGCAPESYRLSCWPLCDPVPFISGTVTSAVIGPLRQGQTYNVTIQGVSGDFYGPSSSVLAFTDSQDVNVEVRLKNNYARRDRGTVEIRYNSSEPWGTICDDSWDLNDARVICKMLGFQDACEAHLNTYYGQGDGPILLDDVRCTGAEASIIHCGNNGWGIHDCRHSASAGVTCLSKVPLRSDPLNLVSTSVGSSSFTVKWDGDCSAHYQVYLNDIPITTTFTKMYTFDNLSPGCRYTAAICNANHMPCSNMTVQTVPGSVKNFTAHAANRSVTLNWLLTFGCTESYRVSCRPSCDPVPFISGSVTTALIGPLKQGQMYTMDIQAVSGGRYGPSSSALVFVEPQNFNFEIRLRSNYTRSDRGTVEIRYNSSEPWGTICDSGWDVNDARIICRTLGFQDACDAHSSAYYGQGTGPIILSGVSCTGYETNFLRCGNSGWGSASHCGQTQAAGVTCLSNELLSSDPMNMMITSSDSSITVKWDGECFAQYQIYLDDLLITTTVNKQYTFTNLSPGYQYTANVCNVRRSACTNVTLSTVFGKQQNVLVTLVGTTARVQWFPPDDKNGNHVQYFVQLLGNGSLQRQIAVFETNTTIDALNPFINYTITIQARIHYSPDIAELWDRYEEPTILTNQYAPGAPSSISVTALSESEIVLTWHEPVFLPDVIRSYTVICNSTESSVAVVDGTQRIYHFFDLSPKMPYRLAVFASTEFGGPGPAAHIVSQTLRPSENMIIPAAAGTIGSVVFVAFLLAFIFMKRQNKCIFARGTTSSTPSSSSELDCITTLGSVGNPSLQLNTFVDRVISMHENEDFKFREEFEVLSTLNTVCSEGDNGEPLKPTLIYGENNRVEHIECCTPLPGNVDSFWELVWKNQATVIVMLNQFVAGDKKQLQYWPERKDTPTIYGRISVTKISENTSKDHTKITLNLQSGSRRRACTNFCIHFWPGSSVPQSCHGLINLISEMDNEHDKNTSKGPKIIHCSGRKSRAGIFVAVDKLYQQIKYKDEIDVLRVVSEVKASLPGSFPVQDQYIFIYDCIRKALESGMIKRCKPIANERYFIPAPAREPANINYALNQDPVLGNPEPPDTNMYDTESCSSFAAPHCENAVHDHVSSHTTKCEDGTTTDHEYEEIRLSQFKPVCSARGESST